MPVLPPRIMTLPEFVAATTPTNIFKRGRDETLHLIDLSLGQFDRIRNTGHLNAKKFHAFRICDQCAAWMIAKNGKETATAALRREGIDRLGNQAWRFLQYWQFADRKIDDAYVGVELRSLRDGYRVERDQYMTSKNHGGRGQNPISASHTHDWMKDLQDEGRLPPALAGKTFDQLTEADFQMLDDVYLPDQANMADPASMAKTKMARSVLFLHVEDRMQRLLLIRGGLLWVGFDSKLNAPKGFYGGSPYAIDKYGNFYTMSLDAAPRGTFFNHSSFNAGKDVICAGILQALQGELTYIDNNSGHYKPTRENLKNAIRLFRDQELSLNRTKVGLREPNPRRPGKLIAYEWNDALAFLNGQPPTTTEEEH